MTLDDTAKILMILTLGTMLGVIWAALVAIVVGWWRMK